LPIAPLYKNKDKTDALLVFAANHPVKAGVCRGREVIRASKRQVFRGKNMLLPLGNLVVTRFPDLEGNRAHLEPPY